MKIRPQFNFNKQHLNKKLREFLSWEKIISISNKIAPVIMAVVTIYFAIIANQIGKRSNEIAETQLKMQITDSSQQLQLNRLTEIIEQLKDEHSTSTKIYAATDKLNQSTETQLETINQQLKLAKRLEIRANQNEEIQEKADMLSLIATFNNLSNLKSNMDVYFINNRPISNRSKIVNQIKKGLESQVENYYLHKNNELRLIWIGFYSHTMNYEFMLDLYDLGERSYIKDKITHDSLAQEFRGKYVDFINKTLPFQNEFFETYINIPIDKFLDNVKLN